MNLVYILPKVDKASHFNHTLNFIERLGEQVNVSVIIENAPEGFIVKNARETVVINHKNSFVRLFKTIQACLSLSSTQTHTFIYSHYTYYGVLASTIAQTLHNITTLYWNCGEPHKFNKRGSLGDIVLRASLWLTDYLVTSCPIMRHYYWQQYNVPKNKIVTIPNDLDLSKIKPNTNPKRKGVLFVHHISRRKGADLVLHVAQELPHVQFTIIGDRSANSDVPLTYLKCRNIEYLGALSNQETMKHLRKTQILLVPSREEGMSRVVMEGMATKTPMVLSDVGNARWMCGKEQQRYIYPVEDFLDFAYGIQALLNTPRSRSKLVSENFEKVKQYDTPIVIDKFIQKIGELA